MPAKNCGKARVAECVYSRPARLRPLPQLNGWKANSVGLSQVYGLTETTPFITVCEPRREHDQLSISERAVIKARQGVELITSGETAVVDEDGNEVLRDGRTVGEIVVRGNVVMEGYYNDPGATGEAMRDG